MQNVNIDIISYFFYSISVQYIGIKMCGYFQSPRSRRQSKIPFICNNIDIK